MGPNLAHLRRHWRYVRWVVVLCKDDFGGRPREDLDLEEWVRQHYSAFIDAGLLVVVRALPDVEDGAFHMSRAKNTSHAAAVTVHRAIISGRGLAAEPQPFEWVAGVDDEADNNHILVNLDGDNIIGDGFIKSVVDSFGVSASDTADASSDSVAWRGHEGATTGRVAGLANLFLRLRGYDEEGVMGSGSQDVDLIKRYNLAGHRQVRAMFTRAGLAESHHVVGFPLPNDSSNRRADRSTSKTVNCFNPMNLSWGQMNERNWNVMSERTQRGEYVRNRDTRPGWPYQIIGGVGVTMAAEPQVTTTTTTDDNDSEPPLHRQRTSRSISVASLPFRFPRRMPQRPVIVLTTGVTLVNRWFNQSMGMQPPLCVRRVHEQAMGRSRGSGRGAVINEQDLEATVLETLSVAEKPVGTIVLVDSRGFKAPPGQRHATHHIGTYYENLRGLIRHDDFKVLWPRLLRRVCDELNSSNRMRPVIVAFYCKSGKHRSVGLAWILTQILREHDWNVELWHMMREYWHLGSCNECIECATDTEAKRALLREVRPQAELLPELHRFHVDVP